MNKEFIKVFYIRLIIQLLIFYSNIKPIIKIILIFLTDHLDLKIYKLKQSNFFNHGLRFRVNEIRNLSS